MEKGYKFRIELNKRQIEQVNINFGCSRFVYNYYLDKWNKSYSETGKGLSYNKCSSDLTKLKKELTWLKEADSTCLQRSLKNLSKAFQAFFNKKVDMPVFHKKRNYASYTTVNNLDKNGYASIRLADNNHIHLPLLGIVKYKNSRKIEGKINFVTISRNASGKYYIGVNVTKEEEKCLPKTNKDVGIDVGIKSFVTLSDGTEIINPPSTKKLEKRLIKEQKKLSRMIQANILSYDKNRKPRFVKALNERRNIQKQRKVVARIYEKITNERRDYEQKLSTFIVRNYDIISIEDLNVEGMLKNHHLAKSIANASFSEFLSMLEYKARWYGKTVQKVERFFPSSKTCHVCGYKKIDLTLKDRSWICPKCKTLLDRDLNAAINIRNEGLRLLGV